MSTEKNSAASGEVIGVPLGAPRRATAATCGPLRALAFYMRHWQQLRAAIRDPYRPERHYMRGRGPKWLATHRANTVTR